MVNQGRVAEVPAVTHWTCPTATRGGEPSKVPGPLQGEHTRQDSRRPCLLSPDPQHLSRLRCQIW